ncbi:hypothetical protein [Xanthomarina gelatinilytica]|uniref:hypothetical protein n=1 Tax=Xanthomarina gelatinilytica TaxID=1137281 RepID=UPI003AA7C0D2
MSTKPISITAYRISLLPFLGLKNRYKETFIVDDNKLIYNSKLGKIGLIESEWIDFIDSYKISGTETIRIGIKNKYKVQFKNKLTTLNRIKSESNLKVYGAEIIIYPGETLMPISDFLDLLKHKLIK